MHEPRDSLEQHDKRLLAQVIHIMLSDGQIEPAEMSFLHQLQSRLGVSKLDLQSLLEQGNPEPVSNTPPEFIAICMAESIRMMTADSEAHENEMRACRHLAIAMGISVEMASKAVDLGCKEALNGHDPLPSIMALIET